MSENDTFFLIINAGIQNSLVIKSLVYLEVLQELKSFV